LTDWKNPRDLPDADGPGRPMLMASEDRPASIPHYDQTGRRLVLTENDGCAKYTADFNPPVVNLKSEFRNPKETSNPNSQCPKTRL
jgi:hypothetical protein